MPVKKLQCFAEIFSVSYSALQFSMSSNARYYCYATPSNLKCSGKSLVFDFESFYSTRKYKQTLRSNIFCLIFQGKRTEEK